MRNNIHNVFIFGAGTSKSSGAPLMLEFFDKARKIYSLYQSFPDIKNYLKDFENVFDSLNDLQGIFSKSFLDLDNLETLYGAIEMGMILEKFGTMEKEKVVQLRKSLINVVVKTLEFSMPFPVSSNRILPLPIYGSFISKIKKYVDEKNKYSFSFITFNYDLALDYTLHFDDIPFNYFTNDNESTDIPLLKLHGSINWYKDSTSNQIETIPLLFSTRLNSGIKKVYYSLGSEVIKNGNEPLIVPPTWNKTEHHQQIENVWKKAAKVLSQADNIFIIGYSLPETDLFFRYLYSLGTESETRLDSIYVINPDETNEDNYRKMIGQDILTRRFHYKPIKFEDSIEFIAQELSKQTSI